MRRRISLNGITFCEIVSWSSTHERTANGIACMILTGCGYHGYIDNIGNTRSEEPPTCLFCVAKRPVAWLE